jgi:hypothetical protein
MDATERNGELPTENTAGDPWIPEKRSGLNFEKITIESIADL